MRQKIDYSFPGLRVRPDPDSPVVWTFQSRCERSDRANFVQLKDSRCWPQRFKSGGNEKLNLYPN
jgi:hypothetical protein